MTGGVRWRSWWLAARMTAWVAVLRVLVRVVSAERLIRLVKSQPEWL